VPLMEICLFLLSFCNFLRTVYVYHESVYTCDISPLNVVKPYTSTMVFGRQYSREKRMRGKNSCRIKVLFVCFWMYFIGLYIIFQDVVEILEPLKQRDTPRLDIYHEMSNTPRLEHPKYRSSSHHNSWQNVTKQADFLVYSAYNVTERDGTAVIRVLGTYENQCGKAQCPVLKDVICIFWESKDGNWTADYASKFLINHDHHYTK